MSQGKRVPQREAQRQLSLAQTGYRKMQKRHQAEQASYQDKISRLEAKNRALLEGSGQ